MLDDLEHTWPLWRARMEDLTRPHLASPTGDGAGSGPGDPTARVATRFVDQVLLGESAPLEILAITRRLHLMVTGTNLRLDRELVDYDGLRRAARCSGAWDATCTELASVGPTGRPDRKGLCIACYGAQYRAERAALAMKMAAAEAHTRHNERADQ